MSGGVDSSTVAYLLHQQKYNVFGVTMDIHEFSYKAVLDAKKVCSDLGIEHYTINLRDEFKKNIIDYFKKTYNDGKTPNPCAICNREIKLNLLLKNAIDLGADVMATGHYARNNFSPLEEAVCKKKDQSYFLSLVKRENLEKLIFPLGGFSSKEEVRKLFNFKNPPEESQDICFLSNNGYKSVFNDIVEAEGDIVHVNSLKTLGKHYGVHNYTVGQRKGMGISHEKPLYVIKIDKKNNTVFVGEKEDLYVSKFEINDINWIIDMPEIFEKYIKIRYISKKILAKIEKLADNRAIVTIVDDLSYDNTTTTAITVAAGQVCCIYDNETVIGGGIIV
jgi:tRNA-specific 2-thiouridylase